MPATSQELLDATVCFCFQIGSVQRLRIAVLMRSVIAVAPATDLTPEALLEAGKCYLCLPGISKADAIELVLLDLIGQNIATGGASGRIGVGSPEGVVTAPPGTTYLDSSNGFFYTKQSGVGNTGWLLIVG